MKTLDEVIEKIESAWVCPSSDEAAEYCELYDVKSDALHYLKEYRGDTDNFEYRIEISYPNCDLQILRYPTIMIDRINCENGIGLLMESLGFTNKVNPGGQVGWVKNGAVFASWEKVRIKDLNPPLSWDELKQMEGKPVWVEYGISFNQKRWVVIHSFHNTGSFCYMNVSGNYPNTFWQKDMGEEEYWQAYRKERR